MPRNREYELRFTLGRTTAEEVVSHPLLRPGLRDRQMGRFVSTYFDTPDGMLQRNRFGLRVRRADNRITHTLKRSGGSFIDRGEWERSHQDSQPDVGWLRETPLEPFLRDEELALSLGPRFGVDLTRTTLPLRYKNAAIEVALDQGMIAAEGIALPVSELEIELKCGSAVVVLDLARKLVRDLPLVLTLASKAERGYGLSDLTWGRPTESIAPPLHAGMSIARAFETVVQVCLHVFLKNSALIGGNEDGEALHKTRIALRHLRAVCQLFGPVLRRKRFALLRPEIKWLSDTLGAARDADVFQSAFYDPVAKAGEVPGAQTLATMMNDHRRRAHEKLRVAITSRRARMLFVELLVFSTDGIRRRVRTRRCRPFVRRALDRRRRALSKRATDLAAQSITELHDVRKAAKMLRYSLDLFAGAPKRGAGKKMRRLGRALKTMQSSLGAVNDEQAMRDHLRQKVLVGRSMNDLDSAEQRRAVLAAAQLCARRTSSEAQLREAEAAARHL